MSGKMIDYIFSKAIIKSIGSVPQLFCFVQVGLMERLRYRTKTTLDFHCESYHTLF